jgi:hypothetical protein
MPVGYLDVPPGIDLGAKRQLLKSMYDAVYEAFPFPDDTGSSCASGRVAP